MKEWKIEVANALSKKAESDREINFKEVANECGYTHIKTQEVKEIVNVFLKNHPTYRPVRFVKNPEKRSSTESLFTTLVLTELEYQTEEPYLPKDCVSDDDDDAKAAIKAKFRRAAEEQSDELDFYMDLLETGINVDMVRKYMGDETADIMLEFCEEHGLI